MQADEHNTGTGDDSALAMALAQAVRAVGRNLAADPRRVQAMVRDVLGSESRARRAEIDAVVLAAEEAVPEDLLAGRIDISAAVDRLSDRGLATDVALFAVAVWRYALGLLADNAEPPTLTKSVEQPSDPTQTSGVSASAPAGSSYRVTDDVSSESTDIAGATEEARRSPPTASTGPHESGDSPPPAVIDRAAQRRWVPAVAVVAVLAAILVFALVRGGFGGEDVSPATEPPIAATSVAPRTSAAATSAAPTTATATTAPATTATATTATATTAPATTAPATSAPPVEPPPPTPSAQFAVEPVDIGDATRTWTTEGQQLTGVVQINNGGPTAVLGWYYEVLPKSMVTSAEQVLPLDANMPVVAFLTDPVVRFLVPIPARSAVSVGYVVNLAAAPTQAELDTWKADQAAAATEFRAAAPALTFSIPSGGVVTSPGVELSGAAPGAERVTIDGVEVEHFELYDATGSWWRPINGLVPGLNAFEVVAVSPYGVETAATWTVTYQPPATTTTPRPRPTPDPDPDPDPPPVTTTTQPQPTTTTQPIPDPP